MRLASRLSVVHVALLLFAVALIGRSAQLQLWQNDQWSARAARQHVAAADLPAPRGMIVDARGEVLAESREVVQLSVSPRDVRDLPALRLALREARVPEAAIRRATDPRHRWVELPGRFLPEQAATLASLRGVHSAPAVERVYTTAAGTRHLVGRTDERSRAVDGLELALDEVLRGAVGNRQVLRDAGGRVFESPGVGGVAAQTGHTVRLTIDHALQDITERALVRGIEETGASGGDIVVLDPHSGEILAMNARRKRQSSASSVLTEPFEPGSTLKPFVAARLLALGRADPADMIETYDGEYVIGSRTIRDTHASDSLSLADVIRFSSNVGIVRFAERLTPGEQYEMLRDLGFGMATGVPFPSEAGGTLREPARWSNTSAASLAMGYEVAVTPLQLALAYAAIANGGELVEPALVQEIVKSDGSIHFQRERRVVRRVMTPAVASELRRMLASVVDSGTATEATLTTYDVGGKTGTARRATAGRYTPGAYTASFVALFPASEPQFVVVVKLDNPKGATYYGGTTAAPVSRALLQSAIAARDASLDQIALAELSPRATIEEPLRPTPSVTTSLVAITHSESQRVSLPAQESPVVRDLTLRPVPNVTDLPVRNAAQRLHAAGFRVSLVRDDKPGTQPAAGALVPGGSVVRLRYRQ